MKKVLLAILVFGSSLSIHANSLKIDDHRCLLFGAKKVKGSIRHCSDETELKQFFSNGSSSYVEYNQQNMATSGDYYCALTPKAVDQKTNGFIKGGNKEMSVKCGKLSEMHSSLIDRAISGKEAEQLKKQNSHHKNISSSLYSGNTEVSVLELAIKQANIDIKNATSIARYFRLKAENNCSNRMLSALNEYYDPLKAKLFDRFSNSKYFVISYSKWKNNCAAKEFKPEAQTDIEDEAYAKSKVIPLIKSHINSYKSYIASNANSSAGSEMLAKEENKSAIFDINGVTVVVNSVRIIKTFFYKNALCIADQTSQENIRVSCLRTVKKGFEEIADLPTNTQGGGSSSSRFNVSQFGICTVAPTKGKNRISMLLKRHVNTGGAWVEKKFQKNPTNYITTMNCIKDLDSKEVVENNLEIDAVSVAKIIKDEMATITFNSEKNTTKGWSTQLLERIRAKRSTSKGHYPGTESLQLISSYLEFEFRPLPIELALGRDKSCLVYGMNFSSIHRSRIDITVKTADGNGRSTEKARANVHTSKKIITFKMCTSENENALGTLALHKAQDIGPKKSFKKALPWQTMDALNGDRITGYQPAMTALRITIKKEIKIEPLYNHYKLVGRAEQNYVRMHTNGLYTTDRYTADNLGRISATPYFPLKIADTGSVFQGRVPKIIRAPQSGNICSSKKVVKDHCCFGLNEGPEMCQSQPLQIVNSVAGIGTTAPGAQDFNFIPFDLNTLQNQALKCMDKNVEQTQDCKENSHFVAIGFISRMMEQLYQMQMQMMFTSFSQSMQSGAAGDLQGYAQATNSLTSINQSAQASSMLSLMASSLGANTNSRVQRTNTAGVMTTDSLVASGLNNTGSNKTLNVSSPTPFNSWLNSSGQYGVVSNMIGMMSIYNQLISKNNVSNHMYGIGSQNRAIAFSNALAFPSAHENTGSNLAANTSTPARDTSVSSGQETVAGVATAEKKLSVGLIYDFMSRSSIELPGGKQKVDGIKELKSTEITQYSKSELKELLETYYDDHTASLIVAGVFH